MKKLLLVLAMVAAMTLALATASTALAERPSELTSFTLPPADKCEASHLHARFCSQ